jgi:cell division protein FtsW
LDRLKHYDYTILIAVLALVGIGIVMIYSASCILAQERFGDPLYFLKRQSLFALLGIVGMVLAMRIPYRAYKYLVYPMIVLAVISLLLVLTPVFRHTVGGANRWIQIGSFTIQPSEGVKLALILYLAYSLARKKARGTIGRFSTGVLPHLIVSGILMFLVLKEPDLGTAVTLGALVFMMMFLAGVRLRYLIMTMFVLGAILYLQLEDYQRQRIVTFSGHLFCPWDASLEDGYHIKQSCYVLANGSWFGQGLGDGRHKLFFLPEPHTDFIISVIGEEWGFVGLLFTCFLFILVLVSGGKIAMAIKDPFGGLLAMGIVLMLGLQVVFNISMALGLLPTKGMVLPFLSYGGSSLVVSLTAVGVLIHLSSHTQQGGSP